MKLTIKDGRDHFYTFDTNRILLLTATDEDMIKQVEFSTEENGEEVSWTSEVLTGSDGIKYVQVPNEFLNGDYTRLVCYYVALDSNGEYTRQKEIFRIRARQEPQDYFLTYSERVTFASIKALTEQYKANASDSADLARRYAEESEDVNVEAGTYSSKHWSAKSEKKFQEIKDYVGSSSNPESALGSIESARASAVSDVNKQKTDSIEAVGTYTSNTAIPSVSQYVEGTSKPALKTYGEQQVNSYVNGTSKLELDRYVNNEKKQVLDNYTSEKKSELDNYTETDKKQILDIYTENEKKAELDSHTEGLKEQLNAHTVSKSGELNEYTTGLKSELDGYTTAKEQDISEFTEQKKTEVQGVYQNDLNKLKGDLAESQITKEIDFSDAELGYVQSDGNGINTGSSAFYHTKLFQVYVGQTIYANVEGYDQSVSVIAYYENGKYISVVSSDSATVKTYSYTADKDMMVTISYNKNREHSGKVFTKVIESTLKIKNDVDNKLKNFESEVNTSISDFYKKSRFQNKYDYIVFDTDNTDYLLFGNYVEPENGRYYATQYTTNYSLLKEFAVIKGDKFIVNGAKSYCLFDENHSYIRGSGLIFDTPYNLIKIENADAKYISINFENQYNCAMCRVLYDSFEVINMGDSIFGFNMPPYDVSTYIQLKTGLSVLNGAFGGTHASTHPTPAYDNFSFYRLADAIYNEDFSTQVNSGSVISASVWAKYKFNLDRLANTDFSKVKIITVEYGTNDWSNGDALDNDNNKLDTSTYLGGLRYGIEKILSKYPHINIILVSPIYRGDVTGGSDVTPNSNGTYLHKFVDGMKTVAKEYHLTFIDNYYGLCLNSLTIETLLLEDKVHPNSNGVKRIAGVVGSTIMNQLDSDKY